MDDQKNYKRIAKNTLMLYFRQILIMGISLYTVRVVLNTLGAEDYGIYNVVAGVVVLFSFLNNAMASGTQRFLNFFLGKNDLIKVNEVFSASLLIHFIITLVFILFSETIGLWIVLKNLNIPKGRETAVFFVYQFSIISTVFAILKVPYTALIIANEKMSFFSIISIIEIILKLLVVYCLLFTSIDKLIEYSFLLAIISSIILLCCKLYCNKIFLITKHQRIYNITLFKEILLFSSMSLLGALANVCNIQGTNIILNMYTNVTVNAAMGIANQVNNNVFSFVNNFQIAFQPQIIKYFAEGKKNEFLILIYRTSKISFLILSYIAIPLLINSEIILTIWLKNIPEYSIQFMQLILICSMIDSWNGPLWMSIQANGDIKKYQIIISCIIFANLPLSFIAFSLGAKPVSFLMIRIVLSGIATVWRIIYLKKKIGLSSFHFFINVILRTILIVFPSFIITKIICSFILNKTYYLLTTCIISILLTSTLTIIFGLNALEKKYFQLQLIRFFNRLFNHILKRK